MIKLQSVSDVARAQGVKVMIYGNAGMGKTRLCVSAPTPVIISGEKGLLSIRNWRGPVIVVETYTQLLDAYNWCQQSKEVNQFQTICLDSVSEIAEIVFSAEKKVQKDPRKLYPDVQESVTDLFRKFRDINGKHVYMSAKQEYSKNDQGLMYFMPMFPGNKLSQAVPYFFDEMFQLYTEDGIDASGQPVRWFCLRTQPTNTIQAKDRSGVLNPIENADPASGGGLTAIINKILAG